MKTTNRVTRSAAVLLIVGFLMLCAGCGTTGTNQTNNLTIIRTFYEEGWNKANPAVVDKLWDERGVFRTGGETMTGREAMKERMRTAFAAMPDLRITIDDIVADGDKVMVRWTAIGTHRGSWKGIQPTNRRIQWSGLEWDRIDGGMIREMQREYDTADFSRQLARPAQTNLTKDESALRALAAETLKAEVSENLEAWLATITEDAVTLNSAGALRGKNAIREYYGRLFKNYDWEGTWSLEAIEFSGDLAVMWGPMETVLTARDGDRRSHTAGYHLDVARRQPDGSWKFTWWTTNTRAVTR